MGGHAFDQSGPDGKPGPRITRLTPSAYTSLRDSTRPILLTYYAEAASPAEAPGKTSHGDIDFLVSSPITPSPSITLATALSATATVVHGPVISYAIPLPSTSPQASSPSEPTTGPPHAQLDVKITTNLPWQLYHESYPDTWQILGVVIRPLGLTATDVGLHLRVEEGEARDRRRSRVFLSSDPEAVTRFLGLDWDVYKKGFGTEEELFAWIVKGRFFSTRAFWAREDDADDRRRLGQRPMFRRFVQDFVPGLEKEVEEREVPSRMEVVQQAVKVFAKEDEYEVRRGEIVREEMGKKAEKLIMEAFEGLVQSSSKRNMVVRAFKRWVTQDESGSLVIREQEEMDPEDQIWLGVLLDEGEEKLDEGRREWLSSNWESLKTLESEREKTAKAGRAASALGMGEYEGNEP